MREIQQSTSDELHIGFIFCVKNTTVSTTRVAFEYAAEILNVLVYVYRFTERYTAFRTFFGKCIRPIRVPGLLNSTMDIQRWSHFPCIVPVLQLRIPTLLVQA